jgi:hypothetical protein
MRFSLRTLLILLAIVPPIGAGIYCDWRRRDQERRDEYEGHLEYQRFMNEAQRLYWPNEKPPYPDVPPRNN